MFRFLPLVSVVTLCVSAQAQNATAVKPLAQAQNEGYTLRILKAKWATSREVAQWGSPDRALTVWVDVTSDKPFVPSAKEKEMGRDSLAARLIDGQSASDSQFVSVGANRYGREIAYIPGEPPVGQSIWQIRGVDPRSKDVVLGWEFLTPGSSPVRADWPPALLEKGVTGPTSQNDKAKTLRFSVRLPLNKVEAPTPLKVVPVPLKTVEGEGNTWQVWAPPIATSKSRSPSMSGATNGLSSPEQEFWRADLNLVVGKQLDNKLPWKFDLRDAEGHEWPAGTTIGTGEINYWRPDGKLLAPNEQIFQLPARFAPSLLPKGPWTLEGRHEPSTQGGADWDVSDIALPPANDSLRPQRQNGGWTLEEIRRFSAENPLPAGWAPPLQKEGVAIKLVLGVPDKDVWTRAYVRDAALSDGTAVVAPFDEPMIIEREETPEGTGNIVFQLVLPPIEAKDATLRFRISGGYGQKAGQKIVVDGLKFEAAKPKNAG